METEVSRERNRKIPANPIHSSPKDWAWDHQACQDFSVILKNENSLDSSSPDQCIPDQYIPDQYIPDQYISEQLCS